jgi:hypothetical protein
VNLKRALIAAAIIAAATLAGCGPATTTAASQPPASTGAPSAAAVASSAPCTTHACIVSDAQRNLVGLVAQDNSVSTRAACKASTVRHNAGNTWTVQCIVTYSDGSTAAGYANILPASNKITFEPAS